MPSTTASTLSSLAICDNGLRVPLYAIAVDREITRSERILARLAIRSSVMPSAKYSWSLSPERFSSGSTTRDLFRGRSDLIGVAAAGNEQNAKPHQSCHYEMPQRQGWSDGVLKTLRRMMPGSEGVSRSGGSISCCESLGRNAWSSVPRE